MKITFLEGESPILWLLWKMMENMFFLVSEHVGMAGNAPPKKIISEGGRGGGNKFKWGEFPPKFPRRLFLLLQNNYFPDLVTVKENPVSTSHFRRLPMIIKISIKC